MHVDPSPIPFIKSNSDDKSDKYCVENKLHRDPTFPKLDLYGFKMALFDNSKPEEFFLFIRNFQMNFEVSGTLDAGAKIKYLRMLLNGKSLCQLDTLSIELVITTS